MKARRRRIYLFFEKLEEELIVRARGTQSDETEYGFFVIYSVYTRENDNFLLRCRTDNYERFSGDII